MRVVVDGTPLCVPLTGIGQYTRGLLEAIAVLRPNWEFIVLSPYPPLLPIKQPNVKHDLIASRGRTDHKSGWRAWWFDAVLPSAIKEVAGQIFWAADGQAPFCLNDTPVALTLYDFVPIRYPRTMSFFPRHYRLANHRQWLSRARWLLPISQAVGDELVSLHGIAPGPVVYPGVDEMFRMARLNSNPVAGRYLVALGTIEPRKNLLGLMHCAQTLVEEGSWPTDLQLRLVGGKGWRDKETLAGIDVLEARGVVKRMGYLAREELPPLLAGARALLMPSLYEGFGMPVAEALACGTTVVCSDIPPFREIADDADALFHGTSQLSMLKAYRYLLRGSAPPQRASPQAARAFTWENSARAFINALEDRTK